MVVIQNMNLKEVSKLLCLSEKSLRRYVRAFKVTGDVVPMKHKNGPKRLLDEYEQVIVLRFILDRPDLYLHELQELLNNHFGVIVSIATICRTLHHMGVTRQVMRHIALQRSELNSCLKFPYNL